MIYIIADEQGAEWSHIFDEGGEEVTRECKFVYNTRGECIQEMRVMRDGEWTLPTASEIFDLQDSLKNANPEALDDPKSYGLRVLDRLPDWAAEIPAASPGM